MINSIIELWNHFTASPFQHVFFALCLAGVLYLLLIFVLGITVFLQRRDYRQAAAANGGNPFENNY